MARAVSGRARLEDELIALVLAAAINCRVDFGQGAGQSRLNWSVRPPRKDWLSVGKRACVWTSAGAEALRVNPSPRRSLRSGAREGDKGEGGRADLAARRRNRTDLCAQADRRGCEGDRGRRDWALRRRGGTAPGPSDHLRRSEGQTRFRPSSSP